MAEIGDDEPVIEEIQDKDPARRWRLLVRHRFGFQAGIDAVAWAVAIVAGTLLRYEFEYALVPWARVVLMIPVAALVQVVAGSAAGLYLGRWRFGSFDETAALVRTVVIATLAITFLNSFVL